MPAIPSSPTALADAAAAAGVPARPLSSTESISLLHQRLPQLAEDDATLVAEALDNLPLALTQAAAYLQNTGLTT